MVASILCVPGVGQAKRAAGLNDTGQTDCIVSGVVSNRCADSGQDAATGRDVDFPDGTDGARGFVFTRVCNSGETAGVGACPAIPARGTLPNQWGCTRDEVTGLLWELKTNDGGLHDRDTLYTNWGDTLDGGDADTKAFAKAVNAAGLCGSKGWRVPTPVELQGLVHYGKPNPTDTFINTPWFPDMVPSQLYYWTAAGSGVYPTFYAFSVSFQNGNVDTDWRGGPLPVRLVRGGR